MQKPIHPPTYNIGDSVILKKMVWGQIVEKEFFVLTITSSWDCNMQNGNYLCYYIYVLVNDLYVQKEKYTIKEHDLEKPLA